MQKKKNIELLIEPLLTHNSDDAIAIFNQFLKHVNNICFDHTLYKNILRLKIYCT